MADSVAPRLGEVLHSNDSKSLWNYTLSPGWTASEVEVFRVALMKFGFGRWSSIVASRCLQGKTVAQLNNQAQRMIGQQSTSEFTGLHFDPSAVFAVNSAKEGHRKNNCLINTENNPTRESVERKRKENQERYGLSASEIDALVVPVLKQADSSVVVVKSVLSLQDKGARRQQKYDRMRVLTRDLARLEAALQRLESGVAADEAIDVDGPERAQPAGKPPAEAAPKAAPKAASEAAKAPKGKAGKAPKAGAGKRSQQQLDEDADAALARRLQMEEGGFDDDMMDLDDDDDFKPTRAKKRGSASSSGKSKKKNKPAARDG